MKTQEEIKITLLETGGKMILSIKYQRIWLNYVLVFSGRKNLQVMKLDT